MGCVKLRIVYVKNGDAVDQVKRLVPLVGERPSSGPDAFIADFLRRYLDASLLVMSRGNVNRVCRKDGVQARVFSKNGGAIRKRFLIAWASAKILFHIIRFRPDRILCGSSGSVLWVSYLAAKVLSVPFVHSRHNQLLIEGAKWLHRLRASVDYWVIRRANGVICHGPFLRDQVIAIGVSVQKVFEFDVRFDPSRYKKDDSTIEIEELSKSGKVLLYVGRIENNKGVIDLFNACRNILPQHRSLKLVYVGRGAAQGLLRSEIEKASLQDKVIFLGHLEHGKLLGIIQTSTALICPTKGQFGEGRSMAAMEGLMMGIPIIAPNFGPFPYLISHEQNGLLFKTDSIEDLSSNIGRLLSDEKLYEKLTCGAQQSGRRIAEPPRSFGEAVEQAFGC